MEGALHAAFARLSRENYGTPWKGARDYQTSSCIGTSTRASRVRYLSIYLGTKYLIRLFMYCTKPQVTEYSSKRAASPFLWRPQCALLRRSSKHQIPGSSRRYASQMRKGKRPERPEGRRPHGVTRTIAADTPWFPRIKDMGRKRVLKC